MGFGYNEFDTGFGMGFQLFDVMFFLICKRIKHLE